MAALNLPVTASYEVHESVRVDTLDNEDHTFCGIMFPVKAKTVLPVEKIVIHSVAVRGQLGDLTVWVTNHDITKDSAGNYNFRLSARHWTKLYTKKHESSQRTYQTLDLTANPIVLQPGQVRIIYIHSTLQGDEAIVYDNTANLAANTQPPPRFEDDKIEIHSGKAHLSATPFGQLPIWGWGNAWRDRREFVGQVNYGTVYQLWSPERHYRFGTNFHGVTEALLMLQRRDTSPVSILPDECIYFILNMCRWDWFLDDGRDLKRRLRARKRQHRALEAERGRQLEAAHQASIEVGNMQVVSDGNDDAEEEKDSHNDGNDCDEDSSENAAMQQEETNWSVELVRNQLREQEEAAAAAAAEAGEDDDDGNESDESAWERANGYRADTSRFQFHDVSSDEEEDVDDDDSDGEDNPQQAWFRRQVARMVVVRRALGQPRP